MKRRYLKCSIWYWKIMFLFVRWSFLIIVCNWLQLFSSSLLFCFPQHFSHVHFGLPQVAVVLWNHVESCFDSSMNEHTDLMTSQNAIDSWWRPKCIWLKYREKKKTIKMGKLVQTNFIRDLPGKYSSYLGKVTYLGQCHFSLLQTLNIYLSVLSSFRIAICYLITFSLISPTIWNHPFNCKFIFEKSRSHREPNLEWRWSWQLMQCFVKNNCSRYEEHILILNITVLHSAQPHLLAFHCWAKPLFISQSISQKHH